MYSGTNIILVTNNESMIGLLSSELVQLRNIDSILIRNYQNTLETVESEKPQAIIINCQNSMEEPFCLDLIKKIKEISSIPIILLVESYNPTFIKVANKIGISDVLSIQYGNSEILMRTIWSLQKNELRQQHKKYEKLLTQLNAFDDKTGFYTTKQGKRVFANEISYLTENHLDAVLMAIRANKDAGIKITKEKLDEVVKGNVRGSDIVIMNDEETYFLILTNTNLSGAMIVWSRIIKTIGSEETICGCITDVAEKSLEQLQILMTNGLNVALTTPNYFIAINDDDDEQNQGRWLEAKGDKNSHNLKLFKQLYEKKTSTVIKPLLEFAKKAAKRKLHNINFEITENEKELNLVVTKKEKTSRLKFEHTGASFISVYYLHDGLDSPENKKTKMEFNEITETAVKEIIDSFIVEFMSYAN